jgi:PHD/YefM family antitoxin component YafN of YafNO toxin-antitoxin module
MPKTILSSRELNQDVGRAKRAAKSGPVIITDRGRPAFVLTTFEAHSKATGGNKLTLYDALSMPEDDIELELPPRELHPDAIEFD